MAKNICFKILTFSTASAVKGRIAYAQEMGDCDGLLKGLGGKPFSIKSLKYNQIRIKMNS